MATVYLGDVGWCWTMLDEVWIRSNIQSNIVHHFLCSYAGSVRWAHARAQARRFLPKHHAWVQHVYFPVHVFQCKIARWCWIRLATPPNIIQHWCAQQCWMMLDDVGLVWPGLDEGSTLIPLDFAFYIFLYPMYLLTIYLITTSINILLFISMTNSNNIYIYIVSTIVPHRFLNLVVDIVRWLHYYSQLGSHPRFGDINTYIHSYSVSDGNNMATVHSSTCD